MRQYTNEISLNEIQNWKLKSFTETKEIWNKTVSKSDFSISRNEIIKIIGANKSDLEISLNKLIERTIIKFRTLFNLTNEQFYYDRAKKKYVLSREVISNNYPTYTFLYNYLNSLKLFHEVNSEELTGFSQTLKFHFKNASAEVPQIFVLMKAIQQGKQVRFAHHNYFNNEINTHVIEPWFIKPDAEKFYVGGFRLEKDEMVAKGYRHFTISQIIADSLEILDNEIDKNRKSEMFDELEFSLFNQCIGVRIYREDAPQEKCLKRTIIVETNFTIGKEWINNPKHIGQKCIKEAKNIDDNFLFEFNNFYYNNAFKQLILGLGTSVKVIEPKEVREDIKNELLKNIQSYA